MAAKRVHLFITGDVQGVGFRWYCREQALELGVAGWVRNLPDGRVEAVFEGEPEAVESVLEWCRRGSSWARVDHVEVSEEAPQGEDRFTIARSRSESQG